MHLEVGWSLDGAAWADPATGPATAGRVRTGPHGLRELLQGRLGLAHPAVAPAVRTTQYLRLLELLRDDPSAPGDGWADGSFATDPWSTASHLLRLRDAALEAGWNPEVGVDAGGPDPLPPRLAVLAAVEERAVVGIPGTTDGNGSRATLSPGPADDLRELCRELTALRTDQVTWPLGVDSVTLLEDPARWPGLWGTLVDELAAAGVAVRIAEDPIPADPELHVVECREEYAAADVAARFLAAGAGAPPGTEPPEPTTVLATADTTLLDQALERRGLPGTGLVPRSADRAPQQLLGLYLDVAIAPVDVHQLAALLDLRVLPPPPDGAEPVGLIPAAARRRLLRALTQEPGVGGPAWRAALDRLAEDVREARDARDVSEDRAARADRALDAARALDALVTHPLPPDGLTPRALASRLDGLADRLRAVAHRAADLVAVLGQVATLREVLDLMEPDRPLRRRTVGQIIEACSSASTSPLARREVAPWSVTDGPARIRPGSTVLWWGPGDDGVRSVPRWDPAESAALTAGGARLRTPEDAVALQVESAARGLRGAGTVVAVLPGRVREQVPPPSGLLADLEARSGDRRRTPEQLIDGDRWELAGRRRTLHRVPDPAPPAREGTAGEDTAREETAGEDTTRRHVPGGAAHLMPTRLSFTQIDALLGCPHHWLLEHRLDVRPAAVAALPTGNRMIGTLVHAVVEELVGAVQDPGLGGAPFSVPDPGRIDEVFDALVPQYASELDLPGRAAERAEVRGRCLRSLEALFAGTARAGLRLTGSERRFELPLGIPLPDGTVHTVTLVGSRDLDARNASGRATVLDLKWSRSRRRYGDLFDTGEAVQLASYAWAIGEEDGTGREQAADVGYFLLRSGEFVAADPALDPHRRETLDTAATWDRALAATGTVLAAIRDGEVRIGCQTLLEEAGLPPDAEHGPYRRAVDAARAAARADGGILVEPHCATGDHAQLCGLREDPR